jgi:hypothetical protein
MNHSAGFETWNLVGSAFSFEAWDFDLVDDAQESFDPVKPQQLDQAHSIQHSKLRWIVLGRE